MLDTDPDTIIGSEAEAVEYLTREGDFDIPCSRYARSTSDAAPIAYNAAAIVSAACGEPVRIRDLDYAMNLVVNDSADIETVFAEYGILTDPEPMPAWEICLLSHPLGCACNG